MSTTQYGVQHTHPRRGPVTYPCDTLAEAIEMADDTPGGVVVSRTITDWTPVDPLPARASGEHAGALKVARQVAAGELNLAQGVDALYWYYPQYGMTLRYAVLGELMQQVDPEAGS